MSVQAPVIQQDPVNVSTEGRWPARPGPAAAARAGTMALPALAGLAVGALVAHVVHRPFAPAATVAWWALVLGLAGAALIAVGRVSRRLLPLAALLELDVAFPGPAPSRVEVALAASRVTNLEEGLRAAKVAAAGSDPDTAARAALALVSSLALHDERGWRRTLRVSRYADLIAARLGVPDHDRDRLRWSSLLHDLGEPDPAQDARPDKGAGGSAIGQVHLADMSGPAEMSDPAEMADLAGRADEAESPISGAGRRAHRPMELSRLVAPLEPWLGTWSSNVAEHHERYDGTGYPYGLSGREISWGARILGVADSYDEIRVAGRGTSVDAARAEVGREAGATLDPDVVRAFEEVPLERLRAAAGDPVTVAGLPVIGGRPQLADAARLVGAAAALGGVALLAAHVRTPVPSFRFAAPAVATPAGDGTAGSPGSTAVAPDPSTTAPAPTTTTPPPTAVPATAPPPQPGSGAAAPVPPFPISGPPSASPAAVVAPGDPPANTAPGPQPNPPAPAPSPAPAPPPAAPPYPVMGPPSYAPTAPAGATPPPPAPPAPLPPAPVPEIAPVTGPPGPQPNPPGVAGSPVTAGDPPASSPTLRTWRDPEAIAATFPPPVADDAVTTAAGTAVNIPVLANKPDPRHTIDPTTLGVIDAPTGGTVAVQPDHTLTYTPAPGFVGTDHLGYQVCTTHGVCASATVTVVVTDRPPHALDLTITLPDGSPVAVPLVAIDVDRVTGVSPTGIGITAPPAGGTAVVNADHTVTYTPAQGFVGTDRFGYQVCDARGTCTPATVTLAVPAPGATPAGADLTATTASGQPVRIDPLAGIPRAGSIVILGDPPAHGTATLGPDEVITYTTAAGFSGTDRFRFWVLDPMGNLTLRTVAVTVG